MAIPSPVGGAAPAAHRFVSALRALDRGELAVFRRNAGRTIAESRDALGLFYRVLPPDKVGSRDEEVYFLVATLFALNDRPHSGDFGTTMLELARRRRSRDGVDRRMSALLDSEFGSVDGRPAGGEMSYRLRQCVRLARSHEVGVDWPRLLADLVWWGHSERRVRKQWARSYFTQVKDDSADAEQSEEV